MAKGKFTVSPVAQRDYRVLGGGRPTGLGAAARAALAQAQAARPPAAVHITPRKDGWAVLSEGRERAAKVLENKAAAVSAGREMASSQRARLIEHGVDGRITKNTKPVPRKRT